MQDRKLEIVSLESSHEQKLLKTKSVMKLSRHDLKLNFFISTKYLPSPSCQYKSEYADTISSLDIEISSPVSN